MAKKILFQKFLESGLYRDIELEHKIGEHIADLYLINGQNKQIVVECQSSNPDITDFRRKTASYSYRGIYVMWIFLLNSELDKCFVKLIHAGDSRLNYESSEIERRCHRWYYGRFYYFYNNKIYAVHFHPIDRWVPSSCEECLRQSDCSFPHPSKCPEYREGYFRRPKALREISIYPVDNPKLVCIDRKDKLRIAKFNEPAWWKV